MPMLLFVCTPFPLEVAINSQRLHNSSKRMVLFTIPSQSSILQYVGLRIVQKYRYPSRQCETLRLLSALPIQFSI